MSTTELDTYLLENWVDLDTAAARASAIQEAVFDAINAAAKEWASIRGWSGVFSYEGDLWVSPPAWTLKAGSRPSADAWFVLKLFNDDEDHWWLTSLMHLGQGSAGFRFSQTRLSAKTWQGIVTDPARLSLLPAFGLQERAALVLPLALDRAAIIDGALAGDYSIAVQPVIVALDQLEAAVDIISPWLGQRPEKS